jgi:hypothetical protein
VISFAKKLEILSPLFGSQSRKRSFTMSKVGSKEQDAEQFLHEAHPESTGANVSMYPPSSLATGLVDVLSVGADEQPNG